MNESASHERRMDRVVPVAMAASSISSSHSYSFTYLLTPPKPRGYLDSAIPEGSLRAVEYADGIQNGAGVCVEYRR